MKRKSRYVDQRSMKKKISTPEEKVRQGRLVFVGVQKEARGAERRGRRQEMKEGSKGRRRRR